MSFYLPFFNGGTTPSINISMKTKYLTHWQKIKTDLVQKYITAFIEFSGTGDVFHIMITSAAATDVV